MAARQTATALAGPSRLAARSLARSYATESAAPAPEASTSAPAVAIDVAPSKSGMRWAPSAGLPMAVAPLHPGPRVRSRYREHYDTTLASDLLYLTYDHALARDGPTAPARPAWDPLDPYTVGRKAPTLPGGAALFAFACLLTRVDAAAAGRAYAAYGGIYIAVAIAWLWAAEGVRPDRWDLAGAALCLLGAAVIFYGPHRA